MASSHRTASKRKRSSVKSTPNKRQRHHTSPSPTRTPAPVPTNKRTKGSVPGPVDDSLYPALQILQEKNNKYLIDWAGTNPATGRRWKPTWEPYDCANQGLIDDWEHIKARRAAARNISESNRTRRTRESENESDIGERSPGPHNHAPVESSTGTPSQRGVRSARRAALVQIPQPDETFKPEEYEYFSQSHSSSALQHSLDSQLGLESTERPIETQDSEVELGDSSSRDTHVEGDTCSSGIVPDSQSEIGSASYIPTTQDTSEPTQQSYFTISGPVGTQEEDKLSTYSAESESESEPDARQSSPIVRPISIELADPIEFTQESSRPLLHSKVVEESQAIEIPESPAQEEPHSLVEPEEEEPQTERLATPSHRSPGKQVERLGAPVENPTSAATVETPAFDSSSRQSVAEQNKAPACQVRIHNESLVELKVSEDFARVAGTHSPAIHETLEHSTLQSQSKSPSKEQQRLPEAESQSSAELVFRQDLSKANAAQSPVEPPRPCEIDPRTKQQGEPDGSSKSSLQSTPEFQSLDSDKENVDRRTIDYLQGHKSEENDNQQRHEQPASVKAVEANCERQSQLASSLVKQAAQTNDLRQASSVHSCGFEDLEQRPRPPHTESSGSQHLQLEDADHRACTSTEVVSEQHTARQPQSSSPQDPIAVSKQAVTDTSTHIRKRLQNNIPEHKSAEQHPTISATDESVQEALLKTSCVEPDSNVPARDPPKSRSQSQLRDLVVENPEAEVPQQEDLLSYRASPFCETPQSARPTAVQDPRIYWDIVGVPEARTARTSTTVSESSAGTSTQQNAQIVPHTQLYINTQECSVGSIRPTTEIHDKSPSPYATSPDSRHDSSQESPIGTLASPSLPSPVPHPPSHSLNVSHSTAPPRPETPQAVSSQPAIMADQGDNELGPIPLEFKRQLQAMQRQGEEEARAKFSHKRPLLKQPGDISSIAGTRSPSTIPDQSPQQQEPISLRTSALIHSAAVEMPEAPSLVPPATITNVPGEKLGTDEDLDVEDADETDADDDDEESVLKDDLHLQPDEHIIPLPLEGRQRHMYLDELSREKSLINSFLIEHQNFGDMEGAEKTLQRLRAVETHMDLIWAETESSSQITGASTQAQWDCDSSVKFRFIGSFFQALREYDLNIVVAIEEANDRLLGMLEKFCQGKSLNYKYPAKGRSADITAVKGALLITILSCESNPVIRPPDVIICLDGALDAQDIRKKRWAHNPDRQIVPILDLVIPRSVSHIERYVAPSLSRKERLHTIFATIGQVHDDIGRPMIKSPSAVAAAELVAGYVTSLFANRPEESTEWPLPSIGSIKEVIEYTSQQYEAAVASSPTPASHAALSLSSKRPLDEENLDPSKRMRMTPQPTSNTQNENEVTHISDSMPSTGMQVSKLQKQLRDEQAARAFYENHAREFESSLDKRHNDYEALTQIHRQTLKELQSSKETKDEAMRVKELLQQRYDRRGAELEEARANLKEQQEINLASEDERVAEITRLRQALAESKAANDLTSKKITTSETTLEYVRSEYQTAQGRAIELAKQNETLTKALAKKDLRDDALEHKKDFHNRSHLQAIKDLKKQQLELETLRRSIQQRDEEIARLSKQKGSTYGTRGTSVPRSPRVGPGSRATSPLLANRDRLSNLRNG